MGSHDTFFFFFFLSFCAVLGSVSVPELGKKISVPRFDPNRRPRVPPGVRVVLCARKQTRGKKDPNLNSLSCLVLDMSRERRTAVSSDMHSLDRSIGI